MGFSVSKKSFSDKNSFFLLAHTIDNFIIFNSDRWDLFSSTATSENLKILNFRAKNKIIEFKLEKNRLSAVLFRSVHEKM